MRPRLTKEDLSFKPSDVITFSTLQKAKRGDEGYFGNSLEQIQYSIDKGWLDRIDRLPPKEIFCETSVSNVFLSECNRQYYGMFLPASKVVKKIKVAH
jgi:hypothetical protein